MVERLWWLPQTTGQHCWKYRFRPALLNRAWLGGWPGRRVSMPPCEEAARVLWWWNLWSGEGASLHTEAGWWSWLKRLSHCLPKRNSCKALSFHSVVVQFFRHLLYFEIHIKNNPGRQAPLLYSPCSFWSPCLEELQEQMRCRHRGLWHMTSTCSFWSAPIHNSFPQLSYADHAVHSLVP